MNFKIDPITSQTIKCFPSLEAKNKCKANDQPCIIIKVKKQRMHKIIEKPEDENKVSSFVNPSDNFMASQLISLKNALSESFGDSVEKEKNQDSAGKKPVGLNELQHLNGFKKCEKRSIGGITNAFSFTNGDSSILETSFADSENTEMESPRFGNKNTYSSRIYHYSNSELKNCLLTSLNFVDICKEQLKVVCQQLTTLQAENKRNIRSFQTIVNYYQASLAKCMEQYELLKKQNIQQSLKITQLSTKQIQMNAKIESQLESKLSIMRELKKQRKASFNEKIEPNPILVREKSRKSSFTQCSQQELLLSPSNSGANLFSSKINLVSSMKLQSFGNRKNDSPPAETLNYYSGQIPNKKKSSQNLDLHSGSRCFKNQKRKISPNNAESQEPNELETQKNEFCKTSKEIHTRLMKLKQDMQQHSRVYREESKYNHA